MVVVVVVFLRMWFVGMTCGWKRALGEVVVRESRTVLAVWRLGRQASTKLRHMEIHVDSAEKGGPRGYFRNDLCSCCPSRPSPKTPQPQLGKVPGRFTAQSVSTKGGLSPVCCGFMCREGFSRKECQASSVPMRKQLQSFVLIQGRLL